MRYLVNRTTAVVLAVSSLALAGGCVAEVGEDDVDEVESELLTAGFAASDTTSELLFYRRSPSLARFLERFDIDAGIDLSACRASGGGHCTMVITIRGHRAAESAVEAA